MEGCSILIVEDEAELSDVLEDYFVVQGFKVFIAADGEEGLKKFNENSPSIVLLDIMLPKIDGIEVCKRISSKSDVPIIMLSAKNGEMDKVICLGIGADDYITKPFSPLELVARVKANLRRYTSLSHEAVKKTSLLEVDKLKMNKESYECFVDDNKVDFTTKEFEVLYFFASNINRVYSKEQVYDKVWGSNEYGDISSVAVYIKRIRRKLESCGVDYIKTVWGIGYKFAV